MKDKKNTTENKLETTTKRIRLPHINQWGMTLDAISRSGIELKNGKLVYALGYQLNKLREGMDKWQKLMSAPRIQEYERKRQACKTLKDIDELETQFQDAIGEIASINDTEMEVTIRAIDPAWLEGETSSLLSQLIRYQDLDDGSPNP